MFKFITIFVLKLIFAVAYEGDSGSIFALPVSSEYKSNEYLQA